MVVFLKSVVVPKFKWIKKHLWAKILPMISTNSLIYSVVYPCKTYVAYATHKRGLHAVTWGCPVLSQAPCPRPSNTSFLQHSSKWSLVHKMWAKETKSVKGVCIENPAFIFLYFGDFGSSSCPLIMNLTAYLRWYAKHCVSSQYPSNISTISDAIVFSVFNVIFNKRGQLFHQKFKLVKARSRWLNA